VPVPRYVQSEDRTHAFRVRSRDHRRPRGAAGDPVTDKFTTLEGLLYGLRSRRKPGPARLLRGIRSVSGAGLRGFAAFRTVSRALSGGGAVLPGASRLLGMAGRMLSPRPTAGCSPSRPGGRVSEALPAHSALSDRLGRAPSRSSPVLPGPEVRPSHGGTAFLRFRHGALCLGLAFAFRWQIAPPLDPEGSHVPAGSSSALAGQRTNHLALHESRSPHGVGTAPRLGPFGPGWSRRPSAFLQPDSQPRGVGDQAITDSRSGLSRQPNVSVRVASR